MITNFANYLTAEGGPLRVRALLAFAFTGVTCYLFLDGQQVPETLLVLNSGVVAFYFGNRA